jgi:hypothetical protein
MEMKPTYPRLDGYTIGRPVDAIFDRNNDLPQPQQFLLTYYNGERERPHAYWTEIVDRTRREIYLTVKIG